MAEQQYTVRQEIKLCNLCLDWIELLLQIRDNTHQRYIDAISALSELSADNQTHKLIEIALSTKDHLRDVSMIPVLLTHIANSCRYFSSSEDSDLEHRIINYLNLYNTEEIKNLRNVVEHIEDYIVGEGHFPELVENEEQHLGSSYGGPDREMYIGVFGKRYCISDINQSVILLKDALVSHKEGLLR